MIKLAIVYISISDLRRYSRNARTQSKKQIRYFADNVKQFGFTNPFPIDNDNIALAG